MAKKKLKTMLMQNFGVTNKEHYGMLWYFLEWSITRWWQWCYNRWKEGDADVGMVSEVVLVAITMVMVLTGMMVVIAEPLRALRARAPLFIQEILALTKSSIRSSTPSCSRCEISY